MTRGSAFSVGYSTSGFAHHRLEETLSVIADLGYEAVSLTLDVQHLDPFAPDLAARVARVAVQRRALELGCVVETGARFLLDPLAKHQPTLLSDARSEQRAAFVTLAIEIARDLGADCVSMWSGARPAGMSVADAWARLTGGMRPLVAAAQRAGVKLAFEPEPGMFVETVAQFAELDARLGRPAGFGLALDVGHCLVTGDIDPADAIRAHASRTVTVALEDMRRGVHEHLPFGQGDLDLRSVIAALVETGFRGIAAVELPRQSHDAVNVARAARASLAAAGAPITRTPPR